MKARRERVEPLLACKQITFSANRAFFDKSDTR
jgi:hypothetical protein